MPTYECVERSSPQSSCAYHLHTPTTLTRPSFSHARHPNTLHVLEPRFRKTSTTTSNIRRLQLSNACLRIGMEDDILHFPEGVHEVHEDDVVGTGLVGISRSSIRGRFDYYYFVEADTMMRSSVLCFPQISTPILNMPPFLTSGETLPSLCRSIAMTAR
jgi:hypothetical protein